jgi:hypothetical protein
LDVDACHTANLLVVVEREHLLSLFDPDSDDNDDEPLVFLGLLVLRYMQAGDTILNTNGSSAETACAKWTKTGSSITKENVKDQKDTGVRLSSFTVAAAGKAGFSVSLPSLMTDLLLDRFTELCSGYATASSSLVHNEY